MVTLKNVLAATDFGDASQAAVEYARSLAEAFGASLHVLHVVTEPLHETWAGYAPGADFMHAVERLQTSARSRIEALPSLAPPAGRIIAATSWGDASEQILRYAQDHDIDVIVCGTHGHRGFDHVLMGSVAERVVRFATCPVLTVHADGSRLTAQGSRVTAHCSALEAEDTKSVS